MTRPLIVRRLELFEAEDSLAARRGVRSGGATHSAKTDNDQIERHGASPAVTTYFSGTRWSSSENQFNTTVNCLSTAIDRMSSDATPMMCSPSGIESELRRDVAGLGSTRPTRTVRLRLAERDARRGAERKAMALGRPAVESQFVAFR